MGHWARSGVQSGRVVAAREVSLCAHTDCAADPATFTDSDTALHVYRVHAGHGPQCLQGLAAVAYLSASDDD